MEFHRVRTERAQEEGNAITVHFLVTHQDSQSYLVFLCPTYAKIPPNILYSMLTRKAHVCQHLKSPYVSILNKAGT